LRFWAFAILEFAILEFAILEFAILELAILDRLRLWAASFPVIHIFEYFLELNYPVRLKTKIIFLASTTFLGSFSCPLYRNLLFPFCKYLLLKHVLESKTALPWIFIPTNAKKDSQEKEFHFAKKKIYFWKKLTPVPET